MERFTSHHLKTALTSGAALLDGTLSFLSMNKDRRKMTGRCPMSDGNVRFRGLSLSTFSLVDIVLT